MDEVLEAFRTCITDRKCENHDCPYESRCNICNNKSQYLQIPKHLALDVERMLVELLKEQPDIVRCKDCKHATMTADGDLCKYCENDIDDDGNLIAVYHSAYWFCADGEQKD